MTTKYNQFYEIKKKKVLKFSDTPCIKWLGLKHTSENEIFTYHVEIDWVGVCAGKGS